MDGLVPFLPSKRIEHALPKPIHLGMPRSYGGAASYSWDVVRPRTRGGIAKGGGRTGEKTKRAAPLEKISERRRKRRKKWRRSLFTSSSDRLEMTANLEEEEEEE